MATKVNHKENLTLLGLISLVLISTIVLALPKASADDIVTDVSITVPAVCSITTNANNNTEHSAIVDPGTYEPNIGKTTIKTICNDAEGFSIYAIGYTNEEYGNTTLKPVTLDATQNSIITGTATTAGNPDTSNWAMKVSPVTGTYAPTIESDTDGSFSDYHKVPSTYTKVATKASNTDITAGSSIEITYSAYIAGTQPADLYNGKVKFTMVHPHNHATPGIPFGLCEDSDTCIQTQTSSSMATKLPNVGDTTTLYDSRDGQAYTVGKLVDGKYWLLDNLALDLTNSTVLNGMNQNNTNASNTTLGYLKGTTTRDPNTDANGKYATAGATNWTSSYSYSAPLVNLTNKDVVPSDTTSTAGGYKVGGYYNYCAASAGSYCYGNGTDAGTSSGDATEDICPKGWRMPTGNTSGEYSALAKNIYGSTGSTSNATDYANYRAALHLPLSGFFYNGSAGNQGGYGYWWSSTRCSNYYMYSLSAYTSGISPADNYSRYSGHSVRCTLAD